MKNLSEYAKQVIKLNAGVETLVGNPIMIERGVYAPTIKGTGFYWTTPGGKIINYPNAYKWRKIYHASTRRLAVSEEWLKNMNLI
jgi:hypothetical protein